MIREGLSDFSAHATAAVSPASRVAFLRRQGTDDQTFRSTDLGIMGSQWVRLTRKGNTFTAERSTDGTIWTGIGAPATDNVAMTARVYIGLIVTSGNDEMATTAEFSSLTITGDVTGDWRTAGVGIAQVPGNDIEPLYVAVEDSTGQVATATHPDSFIVGGTGWHQWQIPFSAFGGIDMASISKVCIGVGDRDHPTAGGRGTVYIDDLAFGRPTP